MNPLHKTICGFAPSLLVLAYYWLDVQCWMIRGDGNNYGSTLTSSPNDNIFVNTVSLRHDFLQYHIWDTH